MPSTITVYHSFQPATKARSSQVNTNFSNYRGDLLPINENTASASDNTHFLGGSDHYWAGAFLGYSKFRSSTTTAGVIARADTAATAGAFLLEISSITVANCGPNGFTGESIEVDSFQLFSLTITANTVFTVPAGISEIMVYLLGGGGGGAGGVDRGGGGGDGAYPLYGNLAVTAGEV